MEFNRITSGTQQSAGRGPEGGVVVNDVNDSNTKVTPSCLGLYKTIVSEIEIARHGSAPVCQAGAHGSLGR